MTQQAMDQQWQAIVQQAKAQQAMALKAANSAAAYMTTA